MSADNLNEVQISVQQWDQTLHPQELISSESYESLLH